jgi:hypothetical protein
MPHNIAFRMAKKEAFSNTYIQNTLQHFYDRRDHTMLNDY